MKLLCPDSDITHKWQHMGLDVHLQASIMVGLFETEAEADKLRGASLYVNEKCNPTEVTRTFIFRLMNRKEHLDLPNFLKNKVATDEKLSDATHIVVGIAYGAEIYCVLAQNVQDDDEDDREEMAEFLTRVSSRMEIALEEKQDDVKFKEQFTKEEKKLVYQINCRVYADLQTQPVRECTLFDAYKYFLKFNQVMTSSTKEAVPVVAVLCPLRIVMKASERLENKFDYRDVDAELVARCCRIWTELEQVISTSESLRLSFKKSSCFPALRQFTKAVSKFKELLKNSWKKSIVKARESGDENDREVEMVAFIAETHPLFKTSRLNQWLRFKKAEMEMVGKLDRINGITFLADKTQLEKELAFSFDKKYTVVLMIPPLEQKTKEILCDLYFFFRLSNKTRLEYWPKKLLAEKCTSLGAGDSKDSDSDEDVLPWHMVTSKKKQVLDKVREMVDFIKKNKHLESVVQFFILPSEEGGKKFGYSYSIYRADNLLKDNLTQLPVPPTGLRMQLDTKRPSMSIELKWNYEDLGYPCSFLVEYRLKDDPEASWKQQKTSKPGETRLTIILRQDSDIEIRVAAETCIGRSEFSQVIDTISTTSDVRPSITVDNELMDSSSAIGEDAVQQISEPIHVPEAGPSVQSVTESFPHKKRRIRKRRGKRTEVVLLPPTQLFVDLVTQTTAELTWMPSPISCSASVAFSYIIRCWPSGQSLPVLVGVDSTRSSFRLEDLQPGSTYSINIVATSEDKQESAPSENIEFTTRQLQDASSPVGISQNHFTTGIDEVKLLRELVTNFKKELDGKNK